MERPAILDIPFDRMKLDDVLTRVSEAIRERRFLHIVTPGPEFIMLAQTDSRFRAALKDAELSLPDGVGVLMAARVLGLPKLQRITGNDLIHGIFRRAETEGWRIFLYGLLRHATVMQSAARRALEEYPSLRIVGAENGFRRWVRLPDAVVCWRIRRSRADVLFVGLGAPAQDLWIARNRHRLGSVRIAAGVGGALDYLARAVRRAPRPVRALGFEWFWRLVTQPRRRFRRILTAIWEFPLAVFQEKLRHG